MTVSYGKKARSRRSVFGLWIPHKTNKPVARTGKSDLSPADFTTSDSPTSEQSATPGARRDQFKTRLTQSGSKILLLLGISGSSNSNKTSVQSGSSEEAPSVERNQALSSRDAEQESPIYMTGARSLESEPPVAASSVNIQPIISDSHPTFSENPQSIGDKVDQGADGEVPPQSVAEGPDVPCTAASEHQSPSDSKLVDRFSRKLSLTFGNPTIIRRTHLRTRPNVLFLDAPISNSPSKDGDGANDSSDPSTIPSSSGSPVGYSTPPTPVTSAEPSPSSEKFKTTAADLSCLSDCLGVSNTADSKSAITPSIVTVETASVAKVYLELYFNSIFQNLNPRLRRQHELEQHIFAFQLAPEEQVQTRRKWVMQENEYLRQCRVLKTGSRCSSCEDAVSNAGYEVIKVLGRGSFGVVRLVREKASGAKSLAEEDLSIQESTSGVTRSRSLAMLRSAVDGAKHSRRRFMTGEKKEVYAMKVIKKSEMIRHCQEGHIRAERDFLVASEKSRWVVPLITSFQDETNLYLVMDYMVGGDFLGLLIRKDTLHEEWTRFYIAEMILCIEEAHRLCWIHRDVKPDNFLISASGHLKISDFGLAFNGHWSHDPAYYYNHRYSLLEKLGINVTGDAEDQANAAELTKGPTSLMNPHGLNDHARHEVPSTDVLEWRNSKGRRRFARSVVGTSQYMAPEVIRGEMYDGRCDWWSLGIIMYECLYGFTPFACDNRHDTKVRILHHTRTLEFPRQKKADKKVSQDAIDLIARILQEREFRLCCQKYQANDMLAGRAVSSHFLYSMDSRYANIASYFVYPNDASDIKAHPFFRGIRWNELHLMQPPLIPRVMNWEDTRYFNDFVKSCGHIDEAPEESDPSEADDDPDTQSNATAPDFHDVHTPDPVPLQQPVPDAVIVAPAEPNAPEAQDAEKRKEKQRARDKILRDQRVGKTALEIRKRGAFLGYTYRRPKGPAMALTTERGRQPFARGQLTDLYVS